MVTQEKGSEPLQNGRDHRALFIRTVCLLFYLADFSKKNNFCLVLWVFLVKGVILFNNYNSQ